MTEIEGLLAQLTLEEKAAFTAGQDLMSTVAVERLGLSPIRMTDGAAGAKWLPGIAEGGEPIAQMWGMRTGPATWIPCGSALGATWDPDLVQRLGELVARETLDHGCRGLLAPTVNLHRSPLAGRNFECFSEDPLLSGRLAVGYIRGVQSRGVFATVKHFVGNEAEFERASINSVIDERTLRELYLVPFEMAVRDAGVLSIMTSYNRLNGRWVTEQAELLQDVLRSEWGFQGFVMTDWGGAVNATTSLGAGLDLEMPGPGRALGPRVAEAVREGRILEADLDAALTRMLSVFEKLGALESPEMTDSLRAPSQEDVDLVRAAAADATVLLTNDGILPLDLARHRRIAVIGEAARAATMGGGGSAQLVPRRLASPVAALRGAIGDAATISYERGVDPHSVPSLVGRPVLPVPGGFRVDIHEGQGTDGPILRSRHLDELLFIYNEVLAGGPAETPWTARISGTVMPETSCRIRLTLGSTSSATLRVDGQMAIDGRFDDMGSLVGLTSSDGAEAPAPIPDYSRLHREDLAFEIDVIEGVPVTLEVEYQHSGATSGAVRVGARNCDPEAMIEAAVAAAAEADVAIVFVGTTTQCETEGRDRASWQLPGRQDELVQRVAEANPRTIVVINSGAPVDLPWVDEVAATLQAWFGGDEMDGAVSDVLLGLSDPGGRLPLTIPRRIEHNPSFDNFPGENGEVRYGEGLYMGYRGYEHRCIEPLFAFGHGLSYTDFDLGAPSLTTTTLHQGESVVVEVPVTNTGDRAGTQVVQCYVAPRSPRLARPPKELKGFAKLRLEPGQTGVARIELDDRAFSYWDDGHTDWESEKARLQSWIDVPASAADSGRGWRVDGGDYDILIGTASDRILHTVTVSTT